MKDGRVKKNSIERREERYYRETNKEKYLTKSAPNKKMDHQLITNK